MPPDPFAPGHKVKEVTISVITAVVFLALLAAALIPVVWLLVRGYRWALS